MYEIVIVVCPLMIEILEDRDWVTTVRLLKVGLVGSGALLVPVPDIERV